MASTTFLLRCILVQQMLVLVVGSGDIFYFSLWPESGRVAAGESRVLRCAVSDSTSITLSWHLNTKPLTYTARRHLRGGHDEESASDLVIGRALPEDTGEYTCIAHNTSSGFALTSLPATLTVLWVGDASRVVLADPRNMSAVRPGSSVTLRCKVEGGPEIYYTWRRNGESVADLEGVTASRRRLIIESYNPSAHHGVYTCAASIHKPGGVIRPTYHAPFLTATTTHYPVVLAVPDQVLPGVIKVPESVVVGAGSRALMECQYDEGALIQWYLQDTGPLTNNSRHLVLGNGSLEVLAASMADEGVYKCVGIHPHRPHRASYAASLTLAYLDKRPPTLEPGPSIGDSHVVGVDGRLRVTCLPPVGLPSPDVSWVLPEHLHEIQPSSMKAEDDTLVLEDVRFDQAGNYSCVANNIAGNSTVSLRLVVTRKPKVQMVTSSLTVVEEETARLECRLDTSPRPYTNVTWKRDAHQVSVDDYRVSVSGMAEGMGEGISVLKIRWSRVEDTGLYRCVVTTAGHQPVITMPAKLHVTERLKFSPPPQDARVEVGGNVSIPCIARGEKTPTVTWHRVTSSKMMEVKSETVRYTDGVLEVTGAEVRDAGRYLCVASSDQGSINASITLAVIEGPVLEWMTRGPLHVDEGVTVVLECRARGTPTPSIHWDYNHTPNNLDPERVEVYGNGTLQVSGIRREDAGIYGCTAGNIGGLVRAEITVSVTGENSHLLVRTVSVAVGGAAAYMALVGAMLIYCRQRRHRLKHSPPHTRGECSEEAQNPEEQERLMQTRVAGGTALSEADIIRERGSGTTKSDTHVDPECQVQLSQVSTHTLGTSTHLGLSQASTKTIGGSSASTQNSSPLQANSSASAQSVAHGANSDLVYMRQESSLTANHISQDKPVIQRENLQILLTLGHGEFGEVQLARLRNTSDEPDVEDASPDPEKLVMVKVVSTRDELQLAEVCREAAMFSGPAHPHLVNTLALCTSHTPHLLVTQYTDWGDLKQFLLATRKESPRPVGSLRPPPLTHHQSLSIALQVGEALEYLSGRRHTHRDVAARNCLITSKLQVKLGSPALTRDAYAAEYCSYKNQVLPVRWLAPEAMMEEEHSMKSSVFSWAWLVWEILTQAAIPHADLPDHQVIAAAEQGNLKCTAPPRTPTDLNNLLTGCWQISPRARPSIHTVVDTLTTMM